MGVWFVLKPWTICGVGLGIVCERAATPCDMGFVGHVVRVASQTTRNLNRRPEQKKIQTPVHTLTDTPQIDTKNQPITSCQPPRIR